MSAWTPKIVPLSKFSSELDGLLKQSFLDFDVKLKTRHAANQWEREIVEKILEDNLYARISATYDWLEDSTGLQARALPVPDAVRYLVETQKLMYYRQEADAQRLLAAAQKQIDRFLFGTNGFQHHQHNLKEDLASDGMESEEEEDECEEGLDELDEYEDETDKYDDEEKDREDDEFLADQTSSATNSPKRKRARKDNSYPLPIEYANFTAAAPITFEQFDQLPIRARSKSIWNKLLLANPNIWKTKCETWYRQLNEAFEARNDDAADPGLLKQVVDVLRQLRQVEKSIYATDKWRSLVKVSSLAVIIAKWSDPRGLHWSARFVKVLHRRHKISVSLNLVLLSWIPSTETRRWVPGELTVEYLSLGSPISDARQLFHALKRNPDAIPREAYPSSVFFLLSLENFQLSLKEWMVYALELKGYNVSIFGQSEKVKSIYRVLKKTITSLSETELLAIEGPALQLILRRSQDFLRYKKKVKNSVLRNREGIRGDCKTCSGREEFEKCVQKVFVEIDPFNDADLGCGVSLANKADCIDPLSNPHGKSAADQSPKPIYHPNHFRLSKCEPNEEIIKRCGMQMYQICDKSTKALLDFWLYNAFTQEVFDVLVCHHASLQKVKEVKRGAQFKHYSEGSMIPKGAREAMGGGEGDTYTFYAGMEAVTTQDLNALFDDAEDSMILLESTRVLSFDIFKSLKETSSSGDRIGTSAATTYMCNNYTSPIHKDFDATTGLCAQFGLQAKSALNEYSFIHADYRVYFVSRSNSLWSFNSNRAHGTMLPSKVPLDLCDSRGGDLAGKSNGGDGPPRVSNGTHITVTERNRLAADKHIRARGWRPNIQSYWEELISAKDSKLD